MSAAGANGLLPFRNRLHAETEEGLIEFIMNQSESQR
jgi:hypothetical protein